MIEVQNIACVNNAAFVMSFGIQIQDDDTGLDLIVDGLDTGNYPINQTRVIDLNDTGINPGTALKPQVRAVWGHANLGDRRVRFQPNGQTATYDVRGTTLNYRGLCETLLEKVQADSGPERGREGLQWPSVIREENPPCLQVGDGSLDGCTQ